MRVRFPWAFATAMALALAWAGPARAGQIGLTWDPVSGAAGYHVYYGTQSGVYGNYVTTTTNSASVTVPDCQTYYLAVKAYNAAGESPAFSNEISGWARPSVTSLTPAAALQGDQVVVDVFGNSFQQGATVEVANPNVLITSTATLSCTHVQLLATIEPTAARVRPAQIGKLDVTVVNPDNVFGLKAQAFEVLVNPARFDINQSDATTTDRIDGKDTVWLARDFGISEASPNYDPDSDFDGDGWVDGNDLAYIASNLGRCWSSSTKSWSTSACPAALR